jgi:predicted CoA-binding protein
MAKMPDAVEAFLSGRRIAVAGVSHDARQPANTILRRLRDSGYETFALNPSLEEAEGQACYPNLASLGAPVHGVMIVTHPDVSASIVEEAADHDVQHVWLHRSFGNGSVSQAAIEVGRTRGLECIVGGCPLMFCEPVDFGHRCMRWWLQRKGRVPGPSLKP